MTRPATAPLVDHPGSFIMEELEERGWTQVDLAYILGMSASQLNQLLTGKYAISAEMAVALGDAFDMPAEFFANLQKLYDLSKARPADPGVRTRAAWQSVFPVREMIRRGWIEDSDPTLLELQMLRFFERDEVSKVPFVSDCAEIVAHAARKTDYSSVTPVQYAWLHRVRKVARTMTLDGSHSASALRAILPEIKRHMVDPEDLGIIPHLLSKAGVRLVFVEALPKSKIDGVCVWLDGQPVIGMTLRLDRFDNFCFVLRHEIEHILQEHGKEQSFAPIDEFEPEDFEGGANDIDAEEKEANAAAAEFCIPQQQLDSFITRKSPFISEKDVLGFAARVEVNPAVIVGQIQYRTKKWNWLRKYLVGVRKNLMDWPYADGWGQVAQTVL